MHAATGTSTRAAQAPAAAAPLLCRRLPRAQRRQLARPAAAAARGTEYGLFVCSASPEVGEALAAAGADWLCLDAQHGAVSSERLKFLLSVTAGRSKRIVRVGGPSDQYGIQQALDLGAEGVMVPLVNSAADAAAAVSFCRFPPDGQRSVAGDVGAVFRHGVGVEVLSRYLQDANRNVEVWLQVETRACFEALDDVLAVPGITCAFLGPADMGFSFGLHIKHNYDLVRMMQSPEMDAIYNTVLQACRKHGVQPGVFCIGEARAAQLAAQGYTQVAYNTDLGVLTSYAQASLAKLRT